MRDKLNKSIRNNVTKLLTKTWVAEGFGQVNINEDLTDNQDEAISKYATNTDLHF